MWGANHGPAGAKARPRGGSSWRDRRAGTEPTHSVKISRMSTSSSEVSLATDMRRSLWLGCSTAMDLRPRALSGLPPRSAAHPPDRAIVPAV